MAAIARVSMAGALCGAPLAAREGKLSTDALTPTLVMKLRLSIVITCVSAALTRIASGWWGRLATIQKAVMTERAVMLCAWLWRSAS